MAAKKIRVHELAKELGLTNKELQDLAARMGVDAKSASSSIEDAQADRRRRRADDEGIRRDVQPEDPKAKKAPATKKAAAKPAAVETTEAPAVETTSDAPRVDVPAAVVAEPATTAELPPLRRPRR